VVSLLRFFFVLRLFESALEAVDGHGENTPSWEVSTVGLQARIRYDTPGVIRMITRDRIPPKALYECEMLWFTSFGAAKLP
jgi:hypothetical protein